MIARVGRVMTELPKLGMELLKVLRQWSLGNKSGSPFKNWVDESRVLSGCPRRAALNVVMPKLGIDRKPGLARCLTS